MVTSETLASEWLGTDYTKFYQAGAVPTIGT